MNVITFMSMTVYGLAVWQHVSKMLFSHCLSAYQCDVDCYGSLLMIK